ncbi:MAG: Mur ligase family protein, partial [Pseudomonadota bacterium]
IVKPYVAIITAIDNIHIANFNSLEALAKAKAEIFSGLDKQGIVIINSLSNCYDFLCNSASKYKKLLRAGIDSEVLSYEVKNNQTFVNLRILDRKIPLSFKFIIGQHQVQNMLITLSCVESLGLDLYKSAKALEAFELPRGRGLVLEIKIAGKKITLIDESYNAGPVSMKAALRNMANYNGRKLAILGGMVDLGEKSRELHIALKDDVALIDKVICYGAQMEDLFNELPEEKRLGIYYDHKSLAKGVSDKLLENDILLIKGSFYLTRLFEFTRYLIEDKLEEIK